MNVYAWLIRREFWERRAIVLVPVILSAILVLLALFGRSEFLRLDAPVTGVAAARIYLAAIGGLFLAVMTSYSGLYLIDCLYDDRRDRSVLFWKSLPVSDTQTVVSKVVIGLIVVPLVSFVAADVTALLVAFILSVRNHGLVSVLWQPTAWLQIQTVWIYLICTAAVWYLPVAGWLLLVSAWVKRAPMLWSVLPLLIVYLVETVFLRTHYLYNLLSERFGGYGRAAYDGAFNPTNSAANIGSLIDLRGFLTNPAVWIGAVAGILLIVGAIQLRMRRGEI